MVNNKNNLPLKLVPIREEALKAIGIIKSADGNTKASKQFLFNAQRTESGRSLPPYFLVYFLLVELLGFKNIGQFEKIAWSIPIDYEGTAFLIEHRKFGLGIFAHDAKTQECQAKEIVKLIHRSVKVAKPFFEWKAKQAVQASKLNVKNHSPELFNRYEYFVNAYEKMSREAIDMGDKYIVTELSKNAKSYSFPASELKINAKWLAQAAIEAFFSWTEHIFIHIAILKRKLSTGDAVSKLAGENWATKYKLALDINDKSTKRHFDILISIRRQLRNFTAHGSFGKQGEAFTFHSAAGSVPVLLNHLKKESIFSLSGEAPFDEHKAIEAIREFISDLWIDDMEPAKLYIQESNLPLILPMTSDGTYKKAMQSIKDMEDFVDCLCDQFDRSANMDF